MSAAEALESKDSEFRRSVAISVGFHAVVIAALLIRAVFLPSEPLQLDDVIRVDMVALPDKMPPMQNIPELDQKLPQESKPKLPDKAVDVKPEPAKPVVIPKETSPAVSLKKTKKEEDAALKRIEAMQKIERMVKEQNQQKAQARPAQPIIKGNQISHGDAMHGIARLEQASYLQSVRSTIRSHYNLPGWLSNTQLSVKVQISIDPRGLVIGRQIAKSSGNAVFDQKVLDAIDSSSPLPAPPSDLSNLISTDGIEIEFVPN